MNSILSTALSGLNAFRTKLQTTAHNIANMATEDYKPLEAGINQGENGQVEVKVTQSEEASYVDISKEAVDMMQAKHGFKANLAVIKAADEMDESTLDIMG